ncbi:AAA family ATPase [Actinoplanes palleronii]|uniref:Orc1-like AAA ATPase domain-containing protein n=1 Tax=Actinoplanes palleronii TaxID=113570 RepID=A0ABQ4B5E2_9ACTN|nr:ATP-binding protein [Actinoplanes palleronii]GIE65899.1 hypothetical protein Apa02nite_020070 [Actinoplanes palleronii]
MAEIVGRADEISAVETLLSDAVQGRGATLVLRGEAGLGKSTLMEHALRTGRERGLRILRVTGVQAEVQISFAGLDHLLRPLRLAPSAAESPYHRAIELIDRLGGAPDPILLTVEDAHWLDVSSWETLAFLGRRVESDRIAVLMAVRDGEDIDRRLAAAGLPELRLESLAAGDAGTLLDRTAPGLPEALRTRVLSESAGNPLGIVELAAAVARSGGSALLPSSLPLSARVERSFNDLVAHLPSASRQLLSIAAFDDGSDLDEILRVAAVLDGAEVPADAIQPAVTARLVTVGEQYDVRFRHPLLRSALRQRAAPGTRREIHAALAEVLAGQPDRQLWHRASAVPGPDEEMARELFATALGAAQQNAVAVALAAAARAVQLSADPAERGSRQIWACDLAHEQGDSATVRRLLAEIDESALRPADRARLIWIREV